MPKVSVVIPTYNCAKYLPETIDSVLNQTYRDFEIIVVDDGSADDTKTITQCYINKYPDKIRYFYQENKGPGAARNFGIKKSVGEYIAFQDADDLWLSTKLKKQVELLEQDAQIALVFSDMQQRLGSEVLYKAFLIEKGYYERICGGNLFLELTKINFIFTPTVVLRKNIFSRIEMFNENYKIGEDYDMWLRVAKDFKVALINEPLVIRRLHSSNTTHNKLLYQHQHIKFLGDFLKNNIFNRVEKNIFRKQRMQGIYHLGGYYFYKGEYKKSIKWFALSIFSRNGLKSFFYLISALCPTKITDFVKSLKEKCEVICQK